MSLIKCSECQKEISDQAVACPSCGNPIHNSIVEANKPVEIELTNKKWKKRSVLAILLFFVGWITMIQSVGFGFFIIFIALIIGVTSRIGAWWTNG